MISEDKFKGMLQMQDVLNQKINPEWRTASYPWHRAIMVEGVELLDHIGWKWWKKQTPDVAQAKIELVDIWHFALSMMLSEDGQPPEAHFNRLMKAQALKHHGKAVREKVDMLVEVAAHGHFDSGVFSGLMDDLGLSWDELYTTYIAKNVLNTFRQDHGYKDGTYIKTWAGDEDNVVLESLMKLRPDATPEQLTAQLERTYAVVLALESK
jgi:dimeric dUTPase (all-alpha-NTP-PPase superfamily)